MSAMGIAMRKGSMLVTISAVLILPALLLVICFTLNKLNSAPKAELMGQFALDAKLARLNNKIHGTVTQLPSIPSMPTHQGRPSKASKAKILSTLAKLNARLAAQMQAKLTENQANMPGDNLMTPHFVEALQDAASNEAEAQPAPPRPNYVPPQLRPTYNHLPYIAPANTLNSYGSPQPYAAPASPTPAQPYAGAAQSMYQRAPAPYPSTYPNAPAQAAAGPTQQLSSYDQQILAQGPPHAQPYVPSPPTYYQAPQQAYQPYPTAAYQPPVEYNTPTAQYSPYAQPYSTASTPADAEPCLMCVHGAKKSGSTALAANTNWRAPDLSLKGKGIHGPLDLKAGQKQQIVNQMKALQRQILGDYRKNTRAADQELLLGPDGGAGV